MQDLLAALADPARWRIVELLAERPRSVGVIAELAGLRQPQATKHLQTLERSGLALSRRSGHRRIYALRPAALDAVVAELTRVAAIAASHAEAQELFARYAADVDAETRSADHTGWADGRTYTFRRTLPVPRETVWSHLTDPRLLARWWRTADLRVGRLEFGPHPGDPIVQEYVDADDRTGADGVIGRAEGVMEEVRDGESLSFRLSPLLSDGTVAFTARYDWVLEDAGAGTDLEVRLRLADSTPPSAEFIAGIRLGWDQALDRLAATLAAGPAPAPRARPGTTPRTGTTHRTATTHQTDTPHRTGTPQED